MESEDKIEKVAVVGAGTMGLGIAQVCASAGLAVQLFDLNTELVSRALGTITKNLDQAIEKKKLEPAQKAEILQRISIATSLQEIDGDLVIEAIVEKLEPKQKLFVELERLHPHLILATNTSTFPIGQVAKLLSKPSQCVGLHFFNPAHVMKLVEVISSEKTAPSLTAQMVSFCRMLGKEPVLVKDSPGFIVNRVARPFYVESLKLLEEEAASLKSIDNLMRGSGFKMGPFELMDLIGVDTNFAVTTSLYEAFGNAARFKPSAIQQQKVIDGHWGKKIGKGFYEYPKN
jgi:3-hydroxybutyryl-CoA dehydrogenase